MNQLDNFAKIFTSETLEKFIVAFGSTDRDSHVTDLLCVVPADSHELMYMSLILLSQITLRAEKRRLKCELSISINEMWIGKARKLKKLIEVADILFPYGAYGPPELILYTDVEGFVGLTPDRLLSSNILCCDALSFENTFYKAQYLQFEDFDPEEETWRMYPCVRVQAGFG